MQYVPNFRELNLLVESGHLEIWKQIENYSYYEVSNLGRVRSLPRDVLMKNGRIRHNKGKILNNVINGRGYVVVTLHNNLGQSVKKVHRLVAENFNQGKTELNNQINHIDGNKTNNNSSNLEWCDQNHNNQHGYKTGLIVTLKAEDHPNSKLTNEQVLEIRKLLNEGLMFHREIAEIYNVPRCLITRINTNRTYKRVK